MSVHDVIDALLLAAVITAWWQSRQVNLGWAVGGLVLTHIIGRHIIAISDQPFLTLGAGFTGLAFAYLLSPILTVYGRIVGTIFALMSAMCFFSVMIGHNPAPGRGLGFDVWNVLSIMLHTAAITILIGVHRHGYILAGPARNRH